MFLFPLTDFQIVSTVFSIATLIAMIVVGKLPEKLAASMLSLLMFSAPLLSLEGAAPLAVGSGITLLGLVWLSLRFDRWWLIMAAGLQLVVFSTHFAPLVLPNTGLWAAVSLRLILWEGLIVICVFAIGECRWASYAKR